MASSPRLEEHIEKPVVKWAKSHLGLEVTKLNVQFSSGLPDRIFWIPGGKPFLIEFKKPGIKKTLSPLQQIKIPLLLKLGYDVEVHDNIEEAKASIQARVDAAKVRIL